MASGTINLANSSYTSGGGYLMGKIEWSSQTNVAANTSTVTATLYCAKGGSTAATYGYWSYSLNIGGTTVSGSPMLSILGWTQVATQTVTIAHDADGQKAIAMTGSVSAPAGTTYAGKVTSGSGTASLDTIPRATTPILSSKTFTMGSPITISLPRASSSFTHEVAYVFGTASGTIASAAGTSCTWTPPTATLAPVIPNAASDTGTITCITKSGTATIGTASVPFTATIPSSVVPTISGFSCQITNNFIPANEGATSPFTGVAIKGKSCISWESTLTGIYGSTISEKYLVIGAEKWSGASGQTSVLKQSGNIAPYLWIKDSRGRAVSHGVSPQITVYDYAIPTITASSAVRCTAAGVEDRGGTYIKLTMAATCSSIGNRNSVSLRYRYKTAAGSFSGWSALTSGDIVAGFPADTTYVVELQAKDAIGGEKTIQITVPTDLACFHLLTGGKGAAFGKYAETVNLLESAWPIKSAGQITSGGNIISQRNAWPGLELRNAAGNSQALIYASDSIGTLGLPLMLRAYNAAGAYNNYKFPAPASGGETSTFDMLKLIKISVSGASSYTSISENWSAFPNEIFACSVSATSPPFSGAAYGYKTGNYGAYIWMDYNTGIKLVRMSNGSPVLQSSL